MPLKRLEALEVLAKGKIVLVIVDDEKCMREAFCMVFHSPIYTVHTAGSFEEARELITRLPESHCWLVDHFLGPGGTGTALLSFRPDFRFTILISGKGDFDLAQTARDKDPFLLIKKPFNTVELLHNVSRVAALGCIFSGCSHDFIPKAKLLFSKNIKKPGEWAEVACMSLRSLQEACRKQTGLAPKQIICLYHALFAALTGLSPAKEEERFYQDAVDYVLKNFGEICLCHNSLKKR